MSIASGVAALASRVATEFNTLRGQIASSLASKADDSAVVKLSGTQTVTGAKTFSAAPSVPTPGSPGNPVRNDDTRLSDVRTPTDGSVTNAKVAGGAAIDETKLSLASDAAVGVASRRTLGTGASQAAAGNHGHSQYAPVNAPSFTTSVTLPGNPSSALQAATKQYADNVAVPPTRYTDFRQRASGQTISNTTVSDDGAAFYVFPSIGTETAATANSRLQITWPTVSAGGALYLQQAVGAPVRRLGVTFGFGPYSDATSGSITLATWTTGANALPGGSTSAQCHFSMTADHWIYSIADSGTITTVATGYYATPLPQDYTEVRAEVVIVGSTAYLALPDGTAAVAVDPRIGATAGATACWEFYRDVNTTAQVPIAIYDTWASSLAQPRGQVTGGGVARMLAGYPTTAAITGYMSSTYVPLTEADLAAGTASRRTLGTGAAQAAAGNHTHASSGGVPGVFPVTAYGATGNGTTDDTAAINSAIAAALAAGTGIVWFPAGTYGTTSVIDIPENVTLEGVHGDTIPYATSPASPCVIKPLGSHSGTAILRMRGKGLTGRTYDHVGARVRNLTLDGTNSPAHTLGIQLIDLVREAELDHVTINASTDTAFSFDANGSASPQSLRLFHCLAKASGWNGFKFSNVPDTTMTDCNSLGAANIGFSVQGFMNGQIANCRSEWSAQHGFYFTSGYWGAGQGSGGCIVSGVTTDRNGYNGIYIDATGAGALQFNGVVNRRDGRNNKAGGGGYAGFFVATGATMPVIVDNLQVYPGVDDDGTGVNSPQVGFSSTGSDPVTVNSGYIFAATTALATGPGSIVDGGVGTATGTTSAPARVAPVGDVPLTQRGPIGGVNTITYAATITPPAGTASEHRVVATGALAVNVPTGGVDGQYLLLWVQASGADRVVTMNASYETTQAVPGRVFTVPSGTWGSFLARNRGGTWVLMGAMPQVQAAASVVAYAAALSLDCTAGSAFAVTATGNITGISITGTPVDGQRLFLEVYASGTRTVTTALSNMSGQTLPISVASGKLGLLGFYYSARAGRWVLSYAYPEP